MEFQSKFRRGVSLIHKFDKSLYYSVQCDCGDSECGSIVEIEVDDEFKLIQLNFYKDVFFDFWRYPDEMYLEDGFISFIKDLFRNKIINATKRFLYRWKKALILGFTGEIKLNGDFVLIDIDHINAFIEALQEGRDYCIEVKKENESNLISGKIGLSGLDGIKYPNAENNPLRSQSSLGSIVNDRKLWGIGPAITYPEDKKLNQTVTRTSGQSGTSENSETSDDPDLSALNQKILDK